LVVQPGVFENYQLKCTTEKTYELTREAAIKESVDIVGQEALIVSNTGKRTSELYEYREEKQEGHERDFLTVGSMGHASPIALGIALNTDKKVICLDGDGALLMHMGSLAVTGSLKPANFIHIVLNNGCHDSVGGQPTCGFDVSFTDIAASSGYNLAIKTKTAEDLRAALGVALDSVGPSFIEVRLKQGSRADLGRPRESPLENKKALMEYLKKE
ncbi:MAG: phosphonopyruvate decarboxylase, partial [Elusimicrobia bacterium]|nr:phosphonopyruvate decarboxylase [Elusimicrobiota bacterium]